MSELKVDGRTFLEVEPFKGSVEVTIENGMFEGGWASLSVEEAVQFSRMIVKAAAEAAGLETASEGANHA